MASVPGVFAAGDVTAAPAWAIASAMPSPMPLLPPVTSATLPLRSNPLYAMDVLSL